MRTLSVLLAIALFIVGVTIMSQSGTGNDVKKDQIGTGAPAAAKEGAATLNLLTPAEERVILHKGTEMPYTDKYYQFNEKGTYLCKRCDAPLYLSEAKFDAGCGWPSFDDEIPGAVKRVTDADGMRTEITCVRCGAHLGHVFLGERFTAKNTRHCVNSISMKFQPASDVQETTNTQTTAQTATETAVFASGCFWGTEYVLERSPGVISTRVGYSGGHTERPTYKEVCSGVTGHAEAVEVIFDPKKTSYETLARLFFETHDPTQVNGQGPDIGEQYRSVVFYTNDEQRKVAESLIETLRKKGLKIATKVEPAQTFWPAEAYHQKYYDHTGGKSYCHIPRKLF